MKKNLLFLCLLIFAAPIFANQTLIIKRDSAAKTPKTMTKQLGKIEVYPFYGYFIGNSLYPVQTINKQINAGGAVSQQINIPNSATKLIFGLGFAYGKSGNNMFLGYCQSSAMPSSVKNGSHIILRVNKVKWNSTSYEPSLNCTLEKVL